MIFVLDSNYYYSIYNMDKQNIYTLDRKGIKDYIHDLQIQVKKNISKDDDIDKFLDETDIFDEFEGILSDQEFGILVLTVLNNFKSEVILNEILDIIERAIKNKYNNE